MKRNDMTLHTFLLLLIPRRHIVISLCTKRLASNERAVGI